VRNIILHTMTIKLNGEKLDVNRDKSLSELVEEVREKCRDRDEALVELKLDGESLAEEQLEELAPKPLSDIEGEIELVSESRDSLSLELVEKALGYIGRLERWREEIEKENFKPDDYEEELEEIIVSFEWLNFALTELGEESSGRPTAGGRELEKYLRDNRLFLSELQGALERPEENRQLIETLFFEELPLWIEDYKENFRELESSLTID